MRRGGLREQRGDRVPGAPDPPWRAASGSRRRSGSRRSCTCRRHPARRGDHGCGAGPGGGPRRRRPRCALRPLARRVGASARAVRRRGALLERARDGFDAVGDRAGAADVLQVTGTVAAQRGDTTLGARAVSREPAIREELGDEAGVAALTSNLGIVAQQQGDGSAAARASPIARWSSTPSSATVAHRHLPGEPCLDGRAGRRPRVGARRCEEAIRLAIEVGDRLNAGIAQNNLGDALRDLGRLDDAGRAYAAAVETYRDLNDLGPLMALLEDVAVLAGRRGDQRRLHAGGCVGRAAPCPRSAAVRGGEAVLVDQLGSAREALGGERRMPRGSGGRGSTSRRRSPSQSRRRGSPDPGFGACRHRVRNSDVGPSRER